MPLAPFLDRFPVTTPGTGTAISADPADEEYVPPPLAEVFGELAGATLADGLLRFHTPASARQAYLACVRLVPDVEERFYPFAFDWQGREMALDIGADGDDADRHVLVVDPGTGAGLATGLGLADWLAAASDEGAEADPFAQQAYAHWCAAVPEAGAPAFDQVVGYRVPLFLAGEDDVHNQELRDRAEYFDTCTELALPTRRLPPGSELSSLVRSPETPR
ncbi:hypothetical protein ACIO3O_41525 [Streptomyces sp. NPDC087440]|uniref:hypothetical protein n=1 Tax=Streptomyces sp. NPDC087440 TaxID=3365790 RepID=UPI0037F70717